jgi:hypothetical protein
MRHAPKNSYYVRRPGDVWRPGTPANHVYFSTELNFMAIAVEPFTFSLPVMNAMVGSSFPA